jgi:hypothetical protein
MTSDVPAEICARTCLTYLLIAVLMMLIAGCASVAIEERPSPEGPAVQKMSRGAARQAIHDSLAKGQLLWVGCVSHRFTINPDALALECTAPRSDRVVAYTLVYKELPPISVYRAASLGIWVVGPKGATAEALWEGEDILEGCRTGPMAPWKCIAWTQEQDAQRFALGLIQLGRISLARQDSLTGLAACQRPVRQQELTDSVRSQQVLAEHYFDEKNFERSLLAYDNGLNVEPCWVDGYFNAAQIAAELGYYQDAVDYMEQFVRLDPNSKDANAARTKIVIWKDQAEHPAVEPMRPTAPQNPAVK